MEVALVGKGIVGGHYGVSAHTSQNYSKGFFGFTAEELAGPAPEKGYTVENHGAHAHDWEVVETLGQYLMAQFLNGSFVSWSAMADGVHEMPYCWGCQAAASFALVINHELVDSVTGCGDQTPRLVETREKCLGEKKLFTSSHREDQAREQQEENDRSNAALKAGWSQEWAEVAIHIRSSYRVSAVKRKGQNPLPALRRTYPGTWTYIPAGEPDTDCKVEEVRFTELAQDKNAELVAPQLGYVDFWGNVWARWQVSYIPAK